MRTLFKLMLVTLLPVCILSAADLQGVIADWNCTQAMVRDGRPKVLKRNQACSLVKKDYHRDAYGLITIDNKFYRLDDNGTKLARELLANTRDRDNLKVIVSGDIEGDVIKVSNMSEL